MYFSFLSFRNSTYCAFALYDWIYYQKCLQIIQFSAMSIIFYNNEKNTHEFFNFIEDRNHS